MPRPTKGRIALAVLFMFLGLNALWQAAQAIAGRSDDPMLLGVLQTFVGIAGISTSVGSWRGARWAPVAAVAYGVITGGMIVALGPILNLEAEERSGLLVGGVSVLLVGLGAAWYLRRQGQLARRGSAAARS